MKKELYRQLTNVLGEIHQWEKEAPGVYYLNVLHPEKGHREYYVVLPNAPISQEARSLGKQLEGTPTLTYLFDFDSGTQSAVDYEILRYKTMHDLPLSDGASLLETALYGMEQCPNYFGVYPIPPVTPWGFTLRHRPLDNGIYWIETDKCMEVLAVCRPVWDSELSDGLLNLGKRMEHEGEMGYLYFERKLACVVLFELLWTRPELTEQGLICEPELMNAIWAYHPEYAVGYNAQEQSGLHDGLGLLLYALGVEDQGLKSSPKHMISIVPGHGTNFIGFWQ